MKTATDSNMGGRWLSTNPKAEQNAIYSKNAESNGLLIDTCQSIRFLRDHLLTNSHLSGIVIDSIIFHILEDWHWLRKGEQPTSTPGSYQAHLSSSIKQLLDNGYIFYINAPGSNLDIPIEKALPDLEY